MGENDLKTNNQVNNINSENNKIERGNNNNLLVILLVIIVVGIVGYFVYTKFIYKDNSNNKKDDSNKEEKNNNGDNAIYKTSDGKFTLRIIDKNDQTAKLLFKNDDIKDSEIKYYAYFNDTLLVVTDVIEDEHYAIYSFAGYENAESYGYSLLVNKDNKKLEIEPKELEDKDITCMDNNFCDFSRHPYFVKSESGYYFGYDDYGLNVLYTTEWKELGYVYLDSSNGNYKLRESDSVGVITYLDYTSECDGNYCTYNLLNPVKYNAKGDNVSGDDARFVTELSKIEITKNNQSIKVKNASINVKTIGKDLYVNDKKIYSSSEDYRKGYTLYYSENVDYVFIIDVSRELCGDGEFVGAIDSKGKFIKIETKYVDDGNHDLIACIETVFMRDNKYYVTYISEALTLESNTIAYDIELIIK